MFTASVLQIDYDLSSLPSESLKTPQALNGLALLVMNEDLFFSCYRNTTACKLHV